MDLCVCCGNKSEGREGCTSSRACKLGEGDTCPPSIAQLSGVSVGEGVLLYCTGLDISDASKGARGGSCVKN